MGHLINPVAFRLGWSKNWVDNYYVGNSYYPQFLHMILRLRLFLTYFFRQTAIVKLGFFFSHFNIAVSLGTLGVHIFYYDSRLEAAWNNYLHSSFPMSLRHQLGVYDRFVFYKFYFIFILLLLINSLVSSKLNLNYLVKTFFKKQRARKNRSRMVDSFTKNIYFLFSNFLRNYFLNFLLVNKNYGKRRGKRASWDYVSFAQNIFFASLSYLIVKPFFYHLASFLKFLFTVLAPGFKSTVSFYLISNNHINASFLSNYIARRLKQGYRLRELINPLRRELKRLKKSQTSRFRKLVEKSQFIGKTSRLNYTSVFSHILLCLFGSFKRVIPKFLGHSQTLVSYEFLLVVFSLVKYHANITIASSQGAYQLGAFSEYNPRLYLHNLLKNPLITQRISGICRVLTARQAESLFFYRATQANLYSRYVFLGIFYPKTSAIMDKPDYYFFLREIMDSFFANYSFISSGDHSISLENRNLSLLSMYRSFNIGFGSFARYLRFSILKFNLAHYFHLMRINKKNARANRRTRKHGLIGFKFHLKGRFTRKQIAASHIFRRGPLPLSTLDINLDYSLSTVVIKNSAVGIKVWLYKADNFYNFFFKTL